ncbi:metallophosphoesterase [uncultured Photobacterium sp.]|uniref:metallophosphoesterase n=1 Tax=uncultured Photobacterium sp. TaxID=173973 RepID=UPI00261BCA81|nr:metallophosphoesterase [uncultured Photobacterium sp.]
MQSGYDLIGDIHGHAGELIKLLGKLGYADSGDGYSHPKRKVIFLGDFIDRGEHLSQHEELLLMVMKMVENGHAYAVLGNHEFNALAFHTLHDGDYLRKHTSKNTEQHQAFLNEFEHKPALKKRILDFFWSLPMWLEIDGIRVVHACWDKKSIQLLQEKSSTRVLSEDLLVEASTKGSDAYMAIETILKGVEVPLPSGINFKDKDGHVRDAVRIQWWNNQAVELGDVALPFELDIGEASRSSIPEYVPRYGEDEIPCFIGHYWLNGQPCVLEKNIACVDYSVAKGGRLVAYRWSGEKVLTNDKFISVE